MLSSMFSSTSVRSVVSSFSVVIFCAVSTLLSFVRILAVRREVGWCDGAG